MRHVCARERIARVDMWKYVKAMVWKRSVQKAEKVSAGNIPHWTVAQGPKKTIL